MPSPNLETLCGLVKQAARDELVPRFAKVARERKEDGSIVTLADRSMQARLQADLKRFWPDYRLLGEEMSAQEQAQLIADPGPGIWILDPLDGTSNYSAGIPYYSVSLALLVGGRVQLGAVYDPSRDECFAAGEGGEAQLNGRPLDTATQPKELRRCIATVDFKRLPATLSQQLAATPPYSSQRSFGSVALDWCWLAAGRFHLYLHGQQKIWDYAAGQVIFEAAGGRACTLHGEAVFSPGGEPRSTLAALDSDLFDQWQEWIDRAKGCATGQLPP